MALGDTTYRGVLKQASAVAVKTVTPSDTVDLPDGIARGFYIGTAGNVAFIAADGNPGDLPSAAPGVEHWIAVRRILATGTTAAGIRALY